MKNTGVYDDDDDDDYAYDEELDSERTLMPYCPTTPLIIDPPLRGSTQGRRIHMLPTTQILQRLLILLAQLMLNIPQKI